MNLSDLSINPAEAAPATLIDFIYKSLIKLFITLSMLEYAGMSINDKILQPPIVKLRMAFLFAAFFKI